MITPLKYWHIKRAANALHAGGVIAYPTEAVFGLGCNPFDLSPVLRLLEIKQRASEAGFILIAESWEQVKMLVQELPANIMKRIHATWPGATTWILPASLHVPMWIRGAHDSVAIRITNHPVARALCMHFGLPLVSTSANLSGQQPIRTIKEVRQQFKSQLNYIVPGRVGDLLRPTEIRDALTGKVVRAG